MHLTVFFVTFLTTVGGGGARLPAPENVWLAGAPKTDGNGETGIRHASAVVHGGGTRRPEATPHTRVIDHNHVFRRVLRHELLRRLEEHIIAAFTRAQRFHPRRQAVQMRSCRSRSKTARRPQTRTRQHDRSCRTAAALLRFRRTRAPRSKADVPLDWAGSRHRRRELHRSDYTTHTPTGPSRHCRGRAQAPRRPVAVVIARQALLGTEREPRPVRRDRTLPKCRELAINVIVPACSRYRLFSPFSLLPPRFRLRRCCIRVCWWRAPRLR